MIDITWLVNVTAALVVVGILASIASSLAQVKNELAGISAALHALAAERDGREDPADGH